MNEQELQMMTNGYKWRDQRISELENKIELLMEIIGKLAPDEPILDGDYISCVFCGSYRGEEHQEGCLWVEARQALEGEA